MMLASLGLAAVGSVLMFRRKKQTHNIIPLQDRVPLSFLKWSDRNENKPMDRLMFIYRWNFDFFLLFYRMV